eukprot:Nitzschia sp. Nitz4//scaffold233_size31335//23674//25487//NITZ4_007954-RA/size31335-processed-gene-0.10-mRNA-1//-1//CDS//3329543388//1158//frame0
MSSTEEKEEDPSTQIQHILGTTRPKHLADGVTSGVGYIVKGAIGGLGCAVLLPAMAASEGHKEAGVVGGVVGGVSGVVGGVLQGVNVAGGGIVTGVSQVVQGAVATPKAVVAPTQGQWWNANQSVWVTTNLLEEERWVETQPTFDEDILGEDAIPESERPVLEEDEEKANTLRKSVADMQLYDALGLDPSVDKHMIKRRYFIMARKYSPARAGSNPKAKAQFEKIGQAYMILTNDELRAKYDRVGLKLLWEPEGTQPAVNPALLYTILFGSEQFENYIGRLAAATEASVGDSSKIVTLEEAQLLQKRRVTRLALKLAARLSKWAEDDLELAAKADWMAEAETLAQASYGVELLHVLGKVYSVSGSKYLGSIVTGGGMPSISQWAKKQYLTLKAETRKVTKAVTGTTGVDVRVEQDRMTLERTIGKAIDKCEGDYDAENFAKTLLKESDLQEQALNLLWRQTVVDVTTTVHEACQMVLYDQNVSVETRKKRGEALEELGNIFLTSEKDEFHPKRQELEEVAFHALLDTIWRQEESRRYDQEV